ncbi:PKD domain-containing protein [Pontibacter cellulosilyticus]|uniref:PKD domain-containing protein n=1 Tax=Pontibacter cellulosilyticus TaxID=1720253 RepID=A0A923N788_9BACT|nr:hypothetical protein [Pontibacter cellulosilyticus]MBC5993516.1 hypothetical protein [Pontibacter cellulosilyticus]
MKRRFHSLTMTVFIFLLILAACSKEEDVSPLQPNQPIIPPPTAPTPPPPGPPTPPVNHTAPVAHAGSDTTIFVPFSTYTLNGKASTGSIVTYEWKLIKGPSLQEVINYGTENKPNKFVDRLIKVGVYDFELTVTDFYNLSAVDTVKITVAEPNCTTANKEVILKDLKWIHPWYTQISISNVFSYVPANSYIKNFYIKRDASDKWELVLPWDYNSSIYNGQHTWDHVEYVEDGIWVLSIYPGNNMTDDTPDVKIEYCN